MITDDEVMRLFERADPARDDDVASVIDATAYLDALRTRSSYVTTVEINPRHTGSVSRHRWRLIAAAAAAGALIVGGALALAATRDDAAGPVTDTPENPPVDAVVEEVATGFIAAYGAFDADQAITYLANDADLSDMGVQTPRELRRLISWYEAGGYQQFADSCEQLADSPSGTTLRCPFDFQALRSGEMGLGPFSGSSFELTVLDGKIVRAAQNLETTEFSSQVWEPFANWVSTAYPDDAAVMYTDEGLGLERHTEASIRLWEQHTREYAAAQTAEVVGIAEDFMEARNAHDTEAALSMVADDGVAAQLCDQSVMPRYACVNDVATEPVMGHVRLDHGAVALAFEAEGIYGVRYRSYACEKDSGSFVTCTYRMDSRLRRLAGLPPVEASSSFSIEDGRIRRLAFPWLNIGFNPGGYNPMEAEPFLQWLEHAHPEALDGGQLVTLDGPVFRTQGQELVLVLTQESLDLLAGYLDEYEATDPPPIQPGDGPATATRLLRTVSGVSFSVVAPNLRWTPGPIERRTGGEQFRSRELYISQSTVGPQGAEAVVLWTSFPGSDEAQSCMPGPADGPTAADLAARVARAPGTELVLAPTDVRVGGRAAKHVEVIVREDLGCDPGYFFTWSDQRFGPFWGGTDPGATIELWIVDVAGTLLIIEAETTAEAGPELDQQIQQIVDSIRFDT